MKVALELIQARIASGKQVSESRGREHSPGQQREQRMRSHSDMTRLGIQWGKSSGSYGTAWGGGKGDETGL